MIGTCLWAAVETIWGVRSRHLADALGVRDGADDHVVPVGQLRVGGHKLGVDRWNTPWPKRLTPEVPGRSTGGSSVPMELPAPVTRTRRPVMTAPTEC